jgi:hypothetical protein
VVCQLPHSNVFTSTPIGGYSASAGTYGSIYVPAYLLDAYKSATNWAYFSDRFVGLEIDPPGGDYTIIEFTIQYNAVPGREETYTCQAKQGMTWQDWASSAYNTTGYQVSGSNIAKDNFPLPSAYIYFNGQKVNITDTIIANAIYSSH